MPGSTKPPEEYVSEIRDAVSAAASSPTFCCGRKCLRTLPTPEVEAHLVDIFTARSFGYAGWWFWVRSLYYSNLPMVKTKQATAKTRSTRCSVFRLPAIPRELCKAAFLVLLGIGERTFAAHCPQASVPTSATASDHGLSGIPAHNTASDAAVAALVQFVLTLANEHGVPNPRFTLTRTDADGPDNILNLIHLPPFITQNSLYIMYRRTDTIPEADKVSARSTFQRLLKDKRLATVKFSQRTRGMCELCKDLRLSLQRANSTERASSVMEVLRQHLQGAHDLRICYKLRLATAVRAWELPRRAETAMISFDYATQLTLPISATETQNEYMGTRFGLDVNLFGICNEGAKEYHHFLYTEGFKHGSVEVISMLHYYFGLPSQVRVANSHQLVVYTDSCSGQNRNKYVHAYLMHRVLAGYHEEISWNFMAVGHTKFSPDRGFALVRNAQKKHDIHTIHDWISIINDISPNGEYKCFGYEVPDDRFRDFKALFDETGIVPIQRIKVLPISEIFYSATFAPDGRRQCTVRLRLSSDEELQQVPAFKSRLSAKELSDGGSLPVWPDGSILQEGKLPPLLPRKPLTFDRHRQLLVNVEKFVGISPEALEWWENLPHVEGSRSGKRKRASEREQERRDKGKEPVDDPASSSTPSSSNRTAMLASSSPAVAQSSSTLSRWERDALSVQSGSRRKK